MDFFKSKNNDQLIVHIWIDGREYIFQIAFASVELESKKI